MDIEAWILSHEMSVRLGFFFGVLVLLALWETGLPRRRLLYAKAVRWGNNLGLVALNTLVLRLLFPAAAVGFAAFAQEQGWGLFNYFSVPYWLALIASFVVMDFAIWLQHVMVHAIPVLWRLHRVHHADLDFDVTTGVRFHPLEILLSMLLKLVVVALLGPPLLAVILFEVVLNATSMFNHSNIRIPLNIDRVLRWFVVTPDMHRVHHSVESDETNSNFGFNFPWWDRLLGTYRAQPRAGHEAMTVGIETFREERWCSWLPGLLTIPFVRGAPGYSINRRKWGGSD